MADGIPHRALVGAHLPALGIEEVPVRVVLAGEILHEFLIVAVRHKADILTVVLAGVDEMLLFGNGAHFGLVERPQWQPHMGQLFLCQIIKHIALIFSLIKAFFQQPAASGLVLLDAGVVAGDDILHPVLLRPAEQVVELHILVAVDAGVGGAARLIDPDEFFDDFLPEIGGEIQHLIGNIHRIGHLSGVLDILFRAAGVEAGLTQRLVPGEPHGDAGAVVPLLLHQPRRHRAVHAAAHGNEGARGPGRRVLCGHSFSFGVFNTLK